MMLVYNKLNTTLAGFGKHKIPGLRLENMHPETIDFPRFSGHVLGGVI